MKPILIRLLVLLLSLVPQLHAAELKLATLFSDHMVLQRDQPVPVSGWADPGEAVTVEYPGQVKTAKAAADGKWTVTLDPLQASAEPRDLKVGNVGEAKDIHPIRKRPVGERLALAARALSYGEQVEYSGPVFMSIAVGNGRAVISFTRTGTGLVANGGELKGFTLAGAEGNFLPARAVIEGSTVVLTSDKIAMPVAVRYGWDKVPEVNLFNREGLPATPFRTDQPVVQKDAVKSNKVDK